MPADVAFDLTIEHGRCVGVRIPEDDGALLALAESTLPAEERDAIVAMGPPRRRSWIGGRVALREALARAGLDAPAVLSDDRGAPLFPPGIVGSVTHKAEVAAALVARRRRLERAAASPSRPTRRARRTSRRRC